MGIAERRIRQKDEVRNSILETAWQIVREEGWQSLSIRKIADAIEYSVPVIYDHFENKDCILLEFGKQGFALLIKKLQAAKKKSAPRKKSSTRTKSAARKKTAKKGGARKSARRTQ